MRVLQYSMCVTSLLALIACGGGGSSSSTASSARSFTPAPPPPEPPPPEPVIVTDPALDAIQVSTTWQRQTAANTLQMHNNANAYSGGGIADGVLYVTGGGHKNWFNDAVAVLDLASFSSTGWVETFQSTADYLQVDDEDAVAIGAELNTNYIAGTSMFQRGAVVGKISYHTFDGIVPVAGGFYTFGGENTYDNPGQPVPAWANRTGSIAQYSEELGWRFISNDLVDSLFDVAHVAACLDYTDSNKIWVVQGWGLYSFDRTTEQITNENIVLPLWAAEGWIECGDGALYIGGGIGNNQFVTLDIASGNWSTAENLPFTSSREGSVVYALGTLYGYESGSLWRWNGSDWDVQASDGPNVQNHSYGRFGYDALHQLFYLVEVVDDVWEVWFVRTQN